MSERDKEGAFCYGDWQSDFQETNDEQRSSPPLNCELGVLVTLKVKTYGFIP